MSHHQRQYTDCHHKPGDGTATLRCGVLATLISWPPGVASSCTGPVAVAAPTGTGTDINCWMPPPPPDTPLPAETGINSCCSGSEPEFWVPAARIICGVVDWPSSCDMDCVGFVRIVEKTPEIDSTYVHLSLAANFSETLLLTFAISRTQLSSK